MQWDMRKFVLKLFDFYCLRLPKQNCGIIFIFVTIGCLFGEWMPTDKFQEMTNSKYRRCVGQHYYPGFQSAIKKLQVIIPEMASDRDSVSWARGRSRPIDDSYKQGFWPDKVFCRQFFWVGQMNLVGQGYPRMISRSGETVPAKKNFAQAPNGKLIN